MARLDALPDELQLEITQYLDIGSLWSLASTCRSVHSNAQETLYQAPAISCMSKHQNDRHYYLLRTMVERPDLKKLVRRVQLSPSTEYVTGELKITFGRDWRPQILHRSAGQFRTWEPVIAAAIILLAPNLMDLSLVLHRGNMHETSNRGACELPQYFIQEIFHSNKNSRCDFNISSLHPFQNLRTLRIETGVFEHEWLNLPCLEHLAIGLGTKAFWSRGGPPPAPSSVTSLELELACTILYPNWLGFGMGNPKDDQLSTFLLTFPHLASLKISFHNMRSFVGPFYSFTNLTGKIASAGRTLEVLDLSSTSSDDRQPWTDPSLSTIWPCSPLTVFPKLRVFRAHQAALPAMGVLPNLDAIFPQTIEVLEVHRVRADIFKWIRHILANRTQLPNLQQIDLCFGEDQKEDLGILATTYTRYCHLEQLSRVGIRLNAWWHGIEHVKIWKNEQLASGWRLTTKIIQDMNS